jgi:glutamate synthase (NADPH/NADH) large chain
VINYFFFVAEELRAIMAELGFRTVAEMVGRVDRLDTKKAAHWKAQGVDLSKLLHQVEPCRHHAQLDRHAGPRPRSRARQRLIAASAPALDPGEPVRLERKVINVNRTVGAMLSGEVARVRPCGPARQHHPSASRAWRASRSARSSRMASRSIWSAMPTTMCKGLSGGRVIVRQPAHVEREPTENIIVGNTVLYGAISGEAFFNGVGGERFAVRNRAPSRWSRARATMAANT